MAILAFVVFFYSTTTTLVYVHQHCYNFLVSYYIAFLGILTDKERIAVEALVLAIAFTRAVLVIGTYYLNRDNNRDIVKCIIAGCKWQAPGTEQMGISRQTPLSVTLLGN